MSTAMATSTCWSTLSALAPDCLSTTALAGSANLRQGKQEQREQQIHRVFDDYRTWVRDSLETEPHPHLQVLAAVLSLGER